MLKGDNAAQSQLEELTLHTCVSPFPDLGRLLFKYGIPRKTDGGSHELLPRQVALEGQGDEEGGRGAWEYGQPVR